MTGYQDASYAESLVEFGTPRRLHQCDSWILDRKIFNTDYIDGMGCYPLFLCDDWSNISNDFKLLGRDLVSLTLVADPFGNYSTELLADIFTDFLIPFKSHFVADLQQTAESFICSHHRKNAKKASTTLCIERCEQPRDYLADWNELYQQLRVRHNIKGIANFSKNAFTHQFATPGLVMFRASYKSQTVGIVLWYVIKDVAYYHLGAFNQQGYDMYASFGLFRHSIESFSSQGIRWLDLGAGAGLVDKDDGLTRFKKGWATGTRTAYLCGKVFQREAYDSLTLKHNGSPRFFPSYRVNEI